MSLLHLPNQINCILHSLYDTLLTSPSCIYAIIDFNYNKGSIGGVVLVRVPTAEVGPKVY